VNFFKRIQKSSNEQESFPSLLLSALGILYPSSSSSSAFSSISPRATIQQHFHPGYLAQFEASCQHMISSSSAANKQFILQMLVILMSWLDMHIHTEEASDRQMDRTAVLQRNYLLNLWFIFIDRLILASIAVLDSDQVDEKLEASIHIALLACIQLIDRHDDNGNGNGYDTQFRSSLQRYRDIMQHHRGTPSIADVAIVLAEEKMLYGYLPLDLVYDDLSLLTSSLSKAIDMDEDERKNLRIRRDRILSSISSILDSSESSRSSSISMPMKQTAAAVVDIDSSSVAMPVEGDLLSRVINNLSMSIDNQDEEEEEEFLFQPFQRSASSQAVNPLLSEARAEVDVSDELMGNSDGDYLSLSYPAFSWLADLDAYDHDHDDDLSSYIPKTSHESSITAAGSDLLPWLSSLPPIGPSSSLRLHSTYSQLDLDLSGARSSMSTTATAAIATELPLGSSINIAALMPPPGLTLSQNSSNSTKAAYLPPPPGFY
jgi:hypothetical protein